MDFDFSPDEQQLKDQVRRFLSDQCPPAAVRAVLDGPQSHDAALWRGLGAQGYLGAALPEDVGGSAVGPLALCVVAEELGRALAPVPFIPSIALAADLIQRHGSPAQRQRWLPGLADGTRIGTLAWAEQAGRVRPDRIQATVQAGRLQGTKLAVPAGDCADLAVVVARDADQPGAPLSLWLVDLQATGVGRQASTSIDPTRSQARLQFSGAEAERLGTAGGGWPALQQALDRAAVLVAFEQIGGADKALETAVAYAQERFAFGRPIGSLQAIKHMLADMYVSATLARSNAYFGAWALQADAPELPEAAATARVAATQAYVHCARNNTQVHGGMGFTWAFDCHLHHRRANALAVLLGGQREWEDRLVEALAARPAAA